MPKRKRRIDFVNTIVKRPFPGMSERGMPDVMPQRDGVDQILIEPQRPSDGRGNGPYIKDVFHSRADMVVFGIEKYLRLVAQSSEIL